MDDDMIARIIRGRYKLIHERGRGSFATVYIACALEDNRIYAVKVMHPELASNSELIARFQREAQILQNLNDPHIVCISDYGNDDNIYYIVMDYIDGQSLKYHILNNGPFKPLQALRYTHEIAEGLHIAYQQRVVHRDIKPQNILINSDDKVKITDFGLARSWDTATLTETDAFMGTAYYVAPEQAENGRSADTRSDLYSTAVVLFEMLTGKPPYEGENAYDIVIRHTNERVPSICQRNPSLPAIVDSFMQKALAKSPAERFATPQEFMTALEQLQGYLQTSPTPPVLEREAKLIMTSNGQTFPLKGKLLLVGRKDPNQGIYPDILLTDTDKTVGRRHAYLRIQQDAYTVEDLHSRNGTRLNGAILTPQEQYPLKDGDILRFGSVEVRFELH